MPTPTYTSLANITLGTAAASVTFGSIPATYRDLIIVMHQGTHVRYDAGRVNFNGDTGSNYSNVGMFNPGATASSNSGPSGFANLTYTTGGDDNNAIMQIMDYSVTDKHKTCLTRNNRPTAQAGNGQAVETTASRWANTAAITSIVISGQTGNFSAGTTFALYGIVS